MRGLFVAVLEEEKKRRRGCVAAARSVLIPTYNLYEEYLSLKPLQDKAGDNKKSTVLIIPVLSNNEWQCRKWSEYVYIIVESLTLPTESSISSHSKVNNDFHLFCHTNCSKLIK